MKSTPQEPVRESILHSIHSFAAKHPAWSPSGLRELLKSHRRELVDAGAVIKMGDGRRAKLVIVENGFLDWVSTQGTGGYR